MSALFEQGFVVRVPSWHRDVNETVFEDYPGRVPAYLAAGHDYKLVEIGVGSIGRVIEDPDRHDGPMVRVENEAGDGWVWKTFRPNEQEKMLMINQMREDGPGPIHGREVRTMLNSYEPVQNEEIWDVLDALLTDSQLNKGMQIKYETGGVLDGGRACYVTAYVDQPFQVPGDDSPIYPYLFATWKHDGQGGITFGGTSVRIVCANTYAAAERDAENRGRKFTLKHTKNVRERIPDVKMALQGIVVTEAEEFEGLAKELADIRFTPSQRDEFITRLVDFPLSRFSEAQQRAMAAEVAQNGGTLPAEVATMRQIVNIDAARDTLRDIFESRETPEAHRLTGWGAFNVATSYLDHHRPGRGGSDIGDKKNVESYIKRQLNPNRAKDQAVELIKAIAA